MSVFFPIISSLIFIHASQCPSPCSTTLQTEIDIDDFYYLMMHFLKIIELVSFGPTLFHSPVVAPPPLKTFAVLTLLSSLV